MAERADYPADEAKVRKLLIALADAKVVEEKTSNPASYATLGVEDMKGTGATGLRVELAGLPKPVTSSSARGAGRALELRAPRRRAAEPG